MQRHISIDVGRSSDQSTIIRMVHPLAVGAAFAVWAHRVCGVTVKHLNASSKLLLSQPRYALRAIDGLQLQHVCLPVSVRVSKLQPMHQL
jgi:hypothetical protein